MHSSRAEESCDQSFDQYIAGRYEKRSPLIICDTMIRLDGDMCVIIGKIFIVAYLRMSVNLPKAHSRFALYWARLIEEHFKFLPNVIIYIYIYRCTFSNRIFAYLFAIIFLDLKNDIDIGDGGDSRIFPSAIKRDESVSFED